MNKSILVISDLHQPYTHVDAVDFLKAVKRKFRPDKIVCIGDECDSHALSFHTSDSELPSAGYELELAISNLQELYKLFPNVQLVDSNHGSMAARRFKFHGIPLKYMKDLGDILEAPEGWKWSKDLILTLPNKQKVYFHHGLKKNSLAVAQQMGMSVVQGHYHTVFNINYSSSPTQLIWAMQVGCLLDDNSLAFAYNKVNLGRPVLGCGIIINGQPRLLPMIVHKGRWIGEIV